MKLVCINRDGCGFYSRLSELEEEDIVLSAPSCPDCGEIAVIFSKNFIPSFYTSEESVDNLLATIHNLYTEKLNEEDNQ